QTVQHLQRCLRDLGSDSVAGDQRRLARHGSPGVRLFTAPVSADQGSSPSPRAVVRKPRRPVRTSTITIVSSAVAGGRAGGRGAPPCATLRGAPTSPPVHAP